MVIFQFFDAGKEISAVYFPLAYLSQYFFGPVLFLISLFIVLIILLQRGRGGGLTGALGGAGGASAFGVKAGDIFTRITAVAVLIWIVLCAVTCYWYLPEKLNIATSPSSSSSNSSVPGMGGIGGIGSDLEGLGGMLDANANTLPTNTPPANPPAASTDASKVDIPIEFPKPAETPATTNAAPSEPLPTDPKP